MRKNIIIILVTISIFVTLVLGIRFYITKNQDNKMGNDLIPIDNLNNDDTNTTIGQEEIFNNKKIGTLTIPKIKLYNIDICEGVELETLSKSIGHFENTNLYEGNVGLAAHNAGTSANYFANINKLEKGDEIYYKTNYGTKKYVVDNITEINSYDWSKSEETEDNRITLITCISGNTNSRLCVQGIEE